MGLKIMGTKSGKNALLQIIKNIIISPSREMVHIMFKTAMIHLGC